MHPAQANYIAAKVSYEALLYKLNAHYRASCPDPDADPWDMPAEQFEALVAANEARRVELGVDAAMEALRDAETQMVEWAKAGVMRLPRYAGLAVSLAPLWERFAANTLPGNIRAQLVDLSFKLRH